MSRTKSEGAKLKRRLWVVENRGRRILSGGRLSDAHKEELAGLRKEATAIRMRLSEIEDAASALSVA